MANIPDKIQTWQMTEPGKLEKKTIDMPEIMPGEVVVEIAGCGICHTDLGYFYDGVQTIQPPPITLGHEISGTVIGGEESMIGKEVIVPAVMPCNNCIICENGRENRCLSQKMPGNSMGIYGGFSSHIVVPSHDLCVVDNRGDKPLEMLAVVADAVTSPYQAAMRGELKAGDLCVVTGAGGGLGSYMTQVCAAIGAKEVIGIDVVEDKLQRAKQYGATHTINARDKSARDVRDEFRAYCKEKGLPNYGWKIFEWTGIGPGQAIGLEILSYTSILVIAGYGMQKNEYQLSRLMAFDAEIRGTWGCPPKHYPAVLKMVLDNKIAVAPFVETRPMSTIAQSFEDVHSGKMDKRIVLIPDF